MKVPAKAISRGTLTEWDLSLFFRMTTVCIFEQPILGYGLLFLATHYPKTVPQAAVRNVNRDLITTCSHGGSQTCAP